MSPCPRLNSIEATRRIIEANLRARILALSMHRDHVHIREILKAGAEGYLLKDSIALLSRTVSSTSAFHEQGRQTELKMGSTARPPPAAPTPPIAVTAPVLDSAHLRPTAERPDESL